MNTPLISISEVLDGGWKLVKDAWKPALKQLLIFIGMTVMYGIVVNLIPFALGNPATNSGPILGATLLTVLVYVLAIMWPVLKLCSIFLQRDGATPAITPEKVSFSTVLSTLWIGVIVAAAVLGASIFLILPGIWLGVTFQFAELLLIEDGKKGLDAVKGSYVLVKGRWWKTFWRIVIPHIVVQVLLGFLLFAVILAGAVVLGVVFGGGAMAGSAVGSAGFLRGLNVAGGIVGVILGLAFLAVYLAVIAGSVLMSLGMKTKLFHSLKTTQNQPQA